MIMKIREEHDGAWESPENQRGNLPNEMFFVRRTEGRLTGKELRGEEEGFQTEDAKGLIHNFYSLCRGEVSVKSTAPKLPLCRLTHKNDDYFRLLPLKWVNIELQPTNLHWIKREEEISFDPPVALFHEFLTEGEMRWAFSETTNNHYIKVDEKPSNSGFAPCKNRSGRCSFFLNDATFSHS